MTNNERRPTIPIVVSASTASSSNGTASAARPDQRRVEPRDAGNERQRDAQLQFSAKRNTWLQHPGCSRKVTLAKMDVPEGIAGPDFAVAMLDGLGDLEAFLPCDDGLDELSLFGEDLRQGPAGDYRGQPCQPEALSERSPLDEGDRRAQWHDGPERGSPANQNACPKIVRDHLQESGRCRLPQRWYARHLPR